MDGSESQEVDVEIEELFHAIMENVKSEGKNTAEIKPEIASEDYKFRRPDDDTEFFAAISQVNRDIPFLSHCRLCGMPHTNMVHIFGSDTATKNIRTKISICCLPITVRETDTLPKQVCLSCLEELDRCWRFHQTVAKAEKQLLAFAGVASGELGKTDRYRGTFPPHDRQHEPTDGISKKTSDIELSNDESMRNPENVETVDATVKRNVSSLKLRPCSVVLSTIEIRQRNNFAAKRKESSSSDSRRQNPGITDDEAFDFGTTTAASGVGQQSSSDSEVTRVIRSSSVIDDMQGKNAENEGHTAINKRSCSKKRRHRCTTCGKMFMFRHQLTKHNKTHAVIRELHRCDQCFKMYKSKCALSKHYKLHTGKGLYICEYCGKKFINETGKICHRRVHTGERPYGCSICKKRFSESSYLKVHKVRVHSGRRAYPCSICDKSFKTLADRKRHMLVHTDKTSQWQCDHCKCYFKARKGLVRHIQKTCLILHVHRDKTSQWQCDHCKCYFKARKGLVRHIHRTCRILPVHRDKTSQWQCDHCKSYFKERKNLVRHILRTCRKWYSRK